MAMDVCQRGFVAKMALRLWLVGLRFKIMTDKEKRLSEDRSPYKSHIFPLYNGIGLTTHELTEISHLGTFMV